MESLLFHLLLVFVKGFITPSDREPVCPSINCHNGGILDINTCLCECNDPYTGFSCEDIKFESAWPQGKYAIPVSMYGCPEEDWQKYHINISLPVHMQDFYWHMTDPLLLYDWWEDTDFIDQLHIMGPYSKRTFQLNLCVRNDQNSVIGEELMGNFCILSVEDSCDNGFKEGRLHVEGYHTEYIGFLGTNDSIELRFCCKEDDTNNIFEVLPTTYPFVLVKGPSSDTCVKQTGFQVIENTVYFPKDDVKFNYTGTISNISVTSTHFGLTFCVYEFDKSDPRPGRRCKYDQYECLDNICLDVEDFCDASSYKDCKGGEDETYCSADIGPGFLSCSESSKVRYVPTFKVCDGIMDCDQGEDEKICTDAKVSYTSSFGEDVGCGGVFNSTSGNFSSVDIDNDGSYEHYLDCRWKVIADDNKIVKLTVHRMDLYKYKCRDFVEIVDGFDINDSVIGKYCVDSIPTVIRSTSNALLVRFFSDKKNSRSGFMASYTVEDALCGGEVLATDLPQRLDFTENQISREIMCRWRISSPYTDQQIQLTATNLSLMVQHECTEEYIEYRDLNMGNRGRSVRHCGKRPPKVFISYNNAVQVNFKMKGMVSIGGFALEFQIFDTTTAKETNYDLQSRTSYYRVSYGKPIYSTSLDSTDVDSLYSEFLLLDVVYSDRTGVFYKTKELYRPWIQVNLQETIRVSHIMLFVDLSKPFLRTVHVHRDQWSFVNYGAYICYHGPMDVDDMVICRRPVAGNYVTLTYEGDGQVVIEKMSIYGVPTRCGRQLGMISGDINDFQIETSNNLDIEHSRALNGHKHWCSAENEKWIMIDLIVPTVVDGVEVEWIRHTYIEIMIEYGVRRNNMTYYREKKDNPEIFRMTKAIDSTALSILRLQSAILLRFIKIIVIYPQDDPLCVAVELLGCTVYGTPTIQCNNFNETLDLGFSSVRGVMLNYPSSHREKNINSLDKCNELTSKSNLYTNTYNNFTKECFMFNISRNNRRLSASWKHVPGQIPGHEVITSERLCFTDFTRDPGEIREDYFLKPNDFLIFTSPYFPKNYGRRTDQEIILSSAKGSFIQITILYISLSAAATRNQLLQVGHPELKQSRCQDVLNIHMGKGFHISITKENEKNYRFAALMSKENTVKITFRSCLRYAMSMGNTYEIKAETKYIPGCIEDATQHSTCRMNSAYLSSLFYPIFSNQSRTTVWEIRGKKGEYIDLSFLDLDIHDTNGFIEVFDYRIDNVRKSFGRFSTFDVGLRSGFKSSWEKMDIEFRVTRDLTGRGFFGKYEIRALSTNNFPALFICDDSWAGFFDGCYKIFYHDNVDQQAAEEHCVNHGSHLVSITSEDEMTFLHELLIKNLDNQTQEIYFIGLKKKRKGFTFTDYIWESGESLLYTSWHTDSTTGYSQPDGLSYEQCTAIILDSVHNKHNWYDVRCQSNNIHAFICEQKHTLLPGRRISDEVKKGIELFDLPLPTRSGYYNCGNGEIISRFVVCDGFIDCSDGSDEQACGNQCTESQFQCKNGHCIHFVFYCDGKDDCHDSSDENRCVWPNCEIRQWQCDSGQCIAAEHRCDLKRDCFDGSDEIGCESCSINTFECYDQTCLSMSNECDKIFDCQNQEDELHHCQMANDPQYSCDGWKKNETMANDAIFVYCEFSDVMTSSYILKEGIYKFSDSFACSRTLEDTSFFSNGIIVRKSDDGKYIEAYSRIDDTVNDKIIKTHINNLQMTGSDFIPITLTRADDSIVPKKDGYYYMKFGPIKCESTSAQLMCNNGKLYNKSQKCLLNIDIFNYVEGCRDMSHLQDCKTFNCPFGYFKCWEGHCLSPKLVCDGSAHCLDGDDERNCDLLTCDGLFRCQNSTNCISHSKICNGDLDCPQGDDEIACITICPLHCSCDGNIYSCFYYKVDLVLPSLPREARKIDTTGSLFQNDTVVVGHFPYLAELSLDHCRIKRVLPKTFEKLINLLYLDLSFNEIEVLNTNTFSGLHQLVNLDLRGNGLLHTIQPGAFLFLVKVHDLKLVGTRLERLEMGTFEGLKELKSLNLSRNQLRVVEDNAFEGLHSVEVIDIKYNKIELYQTGIFFGLYKLKRLFTDSFVFCCLKPDSVEDRNCQPEQDVFSSCSDLMKYGFLRVALWVVTVLALFGNAGVLIYRLIFNRNLLARKTHDFFVFNLSVSDFLTGVYLFIIAVADLKFKGDYILHDKTWRQSVLCQSAGVIITMSCEASVSFIWLITIDRFLVVKYPFGDRKISMKVAIMCTFVVWVSMLIIGIIPLLFTDYFSHSYYTKASVCLALPFSTEKLDGWEYSMAIFVFYNLAIFGVIAYLQFLIYDAANSGKRIIPSRSKNDIKLARKLFLVVLTDFLCWFPVGILGIISLTGQTLPVEIYSVVAVFVLPVNAALNPFLYTFSNVLSKREMKLLTDNADTKIKKQQRDPEVDEKVQYICVKEYSELRYATLTNLLKTRKLNATERYQVFLNLTKAIVYLHKYSLTPCEQITTDIVLVLFDGKCKIRNVQILSQVTDIVKEADTSDDMENLGKIAKNIIRNAIKG